MSWPEAFTNVAYAVGGSCSTLFVVGGCVIIYTMKRIFDEG